MHVHQNLIDVFDKKKRLVIKAPLAKNRMFKVNLSATSIQCLLGDKGLVKGIPTITASRKICEGYVNGKQTRKEFHKATFKRAKQPLEVIYSDVYGPLDVQTIGGNNGVVVSNLLEEKRSERAEQKVDDREVNTRRSDRV
ncbi:hypothetical protein V8G54_003211 [Vigna mungo]|uniref:Uncharacterized protein n=1 Tax=Vigna mungo TaxID=3915 RepID=A0AAQ3PD06_VIGMU